MVSLFTVQPPLHFIPPAYNPWAYRAAKWIGPWWLRYLQGIHPITTEGLETLAHCYHDLEQGKIRFVLAYRHSAHMDPYCLMNTLIQAVPRTAKKQGIPLQKSPNAHFLYDRGVHLWVGSFARWLLPSLGGVSIHRGKLDRPALRTSRDLFLNGAWPLAIAPEGNTNGHNRILNPLEPGVAQLSFWCLEDLHKANRPEKVVIVPIGIRYTYQGDPIPHLSAILSQLETDCGITSGGDPGPVTLPLDQRLYARMLKICEVLLSTLEQFYAKFYPDAQPPQKEEGFTLDPGFEQGIPDPALAQMVKQLRIRLAHLFDVALRAAENRLYGGSKAPKGTLIERRHAVEQAGWDRIFRADIPDLQALSPIEKGLADRIAQESHLHLWHMRLAETFTGIVGQTVDPRPMQERLVETTMHLWDTVTRMKGLDPLGARPPKLGVKSAHLTIGDPISVSDRWEEYQTNRRQAMTGLLGDLQAVMEKNLKGSPGSLAP